MPIEKSNRNLQSLISTLNNDPEKLVSSFVRILSSTDSAYRKLNQKHKKLKSENRHLKNEKDDLVKSEKMASLSQFAMGVAHEINNPISFIISNLNTLKSYLETLSKVRIVIPDSGNTQTSNTVPAKDPQFSGEDSEQIKYILDDLPELVNESIEGANRIKHIVRELMLFKDPERTPARYANINEIIESCFKLTSRRLEHKVTIQRNYGKVPEIKCYPDRLKQLFLNLILNSADAIDRMGTITVKTSLRGDHILIRFSDTGHGIRTKHLSRIFDPFFTTKEVGQGMGLGLSTVYSVVRLHNGDIEVESGQGKGTAFSLNLPLGKNDFDSLHQKLLEV